MKLLSLKFQNRFSIELAEKKALLWDIQPFMTRFRLDEYTNFYMGRRVNWMYVPEIQDSGLFVIQWNRKYCTA
ncbi:MAG: hypothetical protein A3Q59_07660 [Methanomethylophilus alvi]|nr:MAG: hypothetical protein A3Q59_07660 [Methanomethylophilus alvi]